MCEDSHTRRENHSSLTMDVASFAESVGRLLYDLPASSEFATLRGWSSIQEGFPILCFHPEPARGLSLCTLHDVLRKFQPQNERERVTAFDSCVIDLLKWDEHDLRLKLGHHSSKVNRVILEDKVFIALCEECLPATQTTAINCLGHGAPCFLIRVLGMHYHLLIFVLV